MRSPLRATIVILCSGLLAFPANPYGKQYLKQAYGRKAMLNAGTGAAISHARNAPHEWGGGIAGFGKRLGSAVAEHAVKSTIEFGVASVRHEELGYRPSGKHGFGPRLKYALLSTVVTHKTTTGRRTVASGRIAGAVGAGFISRTWQPARLHTIGSGAASSGILLGVDAGTHVAREFWPEIRHPRRRD